MGMSRKAFQALSMLFDQKASVFGVKVFATSQVSPANFDHAVNVLDQYLDSDQDGKPNNSKVVKSLRRNRSAMFLSGNENDAERFFDKNERTIRQSKVHFVELFDDEIHPKPEKEDEFDATLEEVFHLISDLGYSLVYEDVFGLSKDSLIGQAMNHARGGYFKRVPSDYPPQAYYTYEDKSCDYHCQITEYFYWGMTSMLGAQRSQKRFREIRDEWRLNTPEKIENQAPMLFALLSDDRYGLPTVLPSGDL